MHIQRELFGVLARKIDFKKAILLLGPRQVGKTTLVRRLAESLGKPFLYLNGDEEYELVELIITVPLRRLKLLIS